MRIGHDPINFLSSTIQTTALNPASSWNNPLQKFGVDIIQTGRIAMATYFIFKMKINSIQSRNYKTEIEEGSGARISCTPGQDALNNFVISWKVDELETILL